MTNQILDSLLRGDRAALLEALEVSSVGAWQQACIDLITAGPAPINPEAAHTCFTEFGHRVREKLDDDRLLISALRQLLPTLPKMDAEQGVVLYRGENTDRYHEGRLGLCWTMKRPVAEMFAGGLNAMIGQGGVLLRAYAPLRALIAGPNAHSRWLGEEEYLVDPSLLQDVQLIETYPNLLS